MDKLVYYYCDNYKMANILSGKTLRIKSLEIIKNRIEFNVQVMT